MTTLREAAEALLAQWDSPDQGPCHLAPRIAQLRAALAAPPLGMEEIERLIHTLWWPDEAMVKTLLTTIGDALAQARLSGIEAAAKVCPICDGGPGNNCACTCPSGTTP